MKLCVGESTPISPDDACIPVYDVQCRAARDAKSLPDYLHMGDQERSTSAAEMKGGAV